MRLLHTSKLTIEEFPERLRPLYAILSHTWGDNEISLQDYQANDPLTSQGEGWEKIRQSCEIAAEDGFKYLWIDTCCIDKTSSAELSEAINSMYRWYQESEVCYAYLEDISSIDSSKTWRKKFGNCRWFTRGWTLQELIAPSSVIFLSREWTEFGTKNSLHEDISDVTGINSEILLGGDVRKMSVAQRMSWASKRVTTRIEDEAYCLMGIFDVNMPMLYGEGERAFIRLQEEIMRNSDDHSIFAWRSECFNMGGLLATSPSLFSNSGTIVGFKGKDSRPYSITNQGIHINIPLIPNKNWGSEVSYTAILDCKIPSLPHSIIAIELVKKGDTGENYIRKIRGDIEFSSDLFPQWPKSAQRESVFVQQQPPLSEVRALPPFYLRMIQLEKEGLSLSGHYPPSLLVNDKILFDPWRKRGVLQYVGKVQDEWQLVLGVRTDGEKYMFNLLLSKREETLEEIFLSYEVHSQASLSSSSEQGTVWGKSADRVFLGFDNESYIQIGIRKILMDGQRGWALELKWLASMPFQLGLRAS